MYSSSWQLIGNRAAWIHRVDMRTVWLPWSVCMHQQEYRYIPSSRGDSDCSLFFLFCTGLEAVTFHSFSANKHTIVSACWTFSRIVSVFSSARRVYTFVCSIHSHLRCESGSKTSEQNNQLCYLAVLVINLLKIRKW